MSLSPRVTAQCDLLSRKAWYETMGCFDDAGIYQAWDFAQEIFPRQGVSRMVVHVGDRLVGMAQVRIATVPVFKRGIAYVYWGPLWRRNKTEDLEDLKNVAAALKNEYAHRRCLLLRMAPNISSENVDACRLFVELGFVRAEREPYRTVSVDIARTLEDIRKGFAQKWRNCLNRSERNGLEVSAGSSRALYDEFLAMYDEMMARKAFDTGVDPHQWASLVDTLPEKVGLKVLLARAEGKCVAGMVFSHAGDTGVYLLGATSDAGLSLKGSYLLQWQAIQMMKDAGCSTYDLGGIDPDGNPGVYHFKSGLGGREVQHAGVFEYCSSSLSRAVVRLGEVARKLRSKPSHRSKSHG